MGMTTKQILQGVHDWTDDNFGRKDGFYEQLVSGGALALIGQTQRTNDAMLRKSGDPEQVITGDAIITKIQGQTKAWNQCVGTSTTSVTTISGHVYYTNIGGVESLVTGDGRDIAVTGGTDMVIDPTLVYNNTNVATTVAIFKADYEKWFGKPLTYEPYDAGSLRSVQLESLKTTGFNQWDEDAVPTGYIIGDGRIHHGYGTRVASHNFIQVISGQTYYIHTPYSIEAYGVRIALYDNDKNFISVSDKYTKTIIIPSGVCFIRFNTAIQYAQSTYDHDICINISDPAKNGTYEPYEVHSVELPITRLKGKLNGEGDSVIIFPDGMKSAGSVYDEIYTVGDKTYAVKRIGSVDLGSLWFAYNASYGFSSRLSAAKKVSYATKSNIVCALYKTNTYYNVTQKTADMQISCGGLGKDNTLLINNNSYTDAATFKSAMNGVMLYYELETPLVYEVEGFTLPKTYLVDGGGTEEQVQKANVQGIAAILTCIYGVDAVGILDKLPRNYISEASMDNFLAKLNIATGGTWSKTFNENTGEWDFSFQKS